MIGIRGDLGLTFKVPKPSGILKSCSEALANIPPTAANQERTSQSKTVTQRLALIPEGMNSGRLKKPACSRPSFAST